MALTRRLLVAVLFVAPSLEAQSRRGSMDAGPPSPFKQITMRSCASADSTLGPLEHDHDAIVRMWYEPAVDSTRLVSGAERTYQHAGQQAQVWGATAYAGHTPVPYPKADLSVMLMYSAAMRFGGRAVRVPVTMVVDSSASTLDSVTTVPVRTPSETIETLDLGISPNQFFVLAGAREVVFTIGSVEVKLDKEELRDLRGLYRMALCGVNP